MKKISQFGLILASLLFASSAVQAAFVSEPCQLSDVTALGSNSGSCAGSIEGNDKAGDMNGIFGLLGSANWFEVAKIDIDTPNPTTYNITVDSGTSGTWTYTGGNTLSSPFIVTLKAGNEYSAYLFKSSAGLINGNTGTFNISFLNMGKNTPKLSHITIYAVNPVPLPAALWLFGPALLGFMGLRKKV